MQSPETPGAGSGSDDGPTEPLPPAGAETTPDRAGRTRADGGGGDTVAWDDLNATLPFQRTGAESRTPDAPSAGPGDEALVARLRQVAAELGDAEAADDPAGDPPEPL